MKLPKVDFRNPAVLTAIGIIATLVLAVVVVMVLLRTGGAKAVSDNAALIGALVGLGGVFTTQLVNSALEAQRAKGASETEQAQRDRELALEQQRSQDDALLVYLDQMGQLLLDKDRPLHRSTSGDTLRTLARARTLTVLSMLDGARKGNVVQFLYESGLISKGQPIVDLTGADLSGAALCSADLREAALSSTDLKQAKLCSADLREAALSNTDLKQAKLCSAVLYQADLKHADLHSADLTGEADLMGADLRGASLREANLTKANLQGANLTDTLGGDSPDQMLTKGPVTHLEGATLIEANLEGANLYNARLEGARLEGARLEGAHLEGAELSGAKGITTEELEQQAAALEGATMPNGQKYEDSLKSKENGKNE